MGYYDDQMNKTLPEIELSEGYSIRKFNENYGTFDVYYGERKIGHLNWHGYYYATYIPVDREYSGVSVSGYLKMDPANAQRKGAQMIVAYHKVVGDITLPHSSRFFPNALMTTFTMSSYDIKCPLFENVTFAKVHHKRDGKWHVEQLYGKLENTVYDTVQEAINAATSTAKEEGKNVRYVAQEMVKAGWFRTKESAEESVGYGWYKNRYTLNGEEHGSTEIEVKPGDVIMYKDKTWTVQ